MTNREIPYEIKGTELVTIRTFQAASQAMQRRGNIRKGGPKSWTGEVIKRWVEQFPAQGEEFRTDNSVLEQHSLASLPKDGWRLPYGVDGSEGYQLMCEIDRRRQNGQSLDGLAWPPSNDPYAPANDPNHPYYLG
jgi:hypothetical protein